MQDRGRLDLLIVQKANCANIAANLIDASDEKFERFFEKLYRLDKQFLASFVKNNQEKIPKNQFDFAKDFYLKRGWNINWAKHEKGGTE